MVCMACMVVVVGPTKTAKHHALCCPQTPASFVAHKERVVSYVHWSHCSLNSLAKTPQSPRIKFGPRQTSNASIMVSDSPVYMTLRHDTYTILFRDANTGTDFYIDGTEITSQGQGHIDPRDDKETKIDLAQHYLLHNLDANGYDCRALSRLLRTNNLKILLPMVIGMYLDEDAGDAEKGLRAVYVLLGRMISMLEQRDLARDKLRAIKRKRDAEAARREEEAGEGDDEMF